MKNVKTEISKDMLEKIQKFKRNDMDEMVVETNMRTRFQPIQKKMIFFTDVLINGELLETQEYLVPNSLEDKNDYFIKISDGLGVLVAKVLRDIYTRV
jgi:hypothetical protein